MTNSVFLTNKNARSCQLYYTKMQHFMLIVRLQRIYALVRQFQPRPAPPPPPPPPRLLRGIFPPYSPGGGVLANFALPGGRNLPTTRPPPRFLAHRGFYWENKQIGSSVKEGKELSRIVKACFRFYACIPSLRIKPELHSEIGIEAIDVNQCFFPY